MTVRATERLAREGRLYPSVILYGGDTRERRQAALCLARTLLCEASAEERPCNVCRHCSRIVWRGEAGDSFHPDFHVLERDLKTATSVDATKSFLQEAQISPFEARGQVFVIASADTLTGEAANALLKTLEEPPTRSPRHFLLLSPSRYDLLPTVRSRSLPVYLGASEGLDPVQVERLAEQFAVNVGEFIDSRMALHLLAAAEGLAAAGGWQDPRDSAPWTLAAAAVKESGNRLPRATAGHLLALAEDLLGGWRMRVRGVRPQRILEGLVFRHLSVLPERLD